jgi:sulfatase maturation enzyme AslB (radical SAM superfamily)
MHKTFCVLPWFGKEITWGSVETHCCLLPKKYDIKKIQTQMLNGEKPVECQKCWNLEANGLQSDRQLKNSALDWYWDRDLGSIKQDAEQGLEKVLMLKLFTSFTCNATCVSCGSHLSSSWGQLEHRMDPRIPIKRYYSVDLNDVIKSVDLKDLKMLSLVGGEPLYEKKNFELLELLLERGNDSVFISIVTNGSTSLTDRQKLVLSKFKNLNFCVSIDGTGPVFEYLRFPLKWNDILENLKFFNTISKEVSANYTLSNLNVLYHNETVAWFKENNIPYSNNPVYSPAWLQPRALPVSVKQVLKQQLSDSDYQTYIGTHLVEDDRNFAKFLTEIKKQDVAKQIRMADYVPEFAELIGFDLP